MNHQRGGDIGGVDRAAGRARSGLRFALVEKRFGIGRFENESDAVKIRITSPSIRPSAQNLTCACKCFQIAARAEIESTQQNTISCTALPAAIMVTNSLDLNRIVEQSDG